MSKFLSSLASLLLTVSLVCSQTPPPQQEADEIVRVRSNLVQIDVVVTDKNEQTIRGLRPADFELSENGKRQEIKFFEFVDTTESQPLTSAKDPSIPAGALDATRNLTAATLKRTIVFVVDDLTIPPDEIARVRLLLTDFVETKMRDGDLVAIIRTVSGVRLLQQFTSDRNALRRAIERLNPRANPVATGATATQSLNILPSLDGDATLSLTENPEILNALADSSNQAAIQELRASIGVFVASSVIDNLKQLPGRKDLFLISGELALNAPSGQSVPRNDNLNPTTDVSQSFATLASGNVSLLLRGLADKAIRAGVVINTLDIRGLKAAPSFDATPGRSALGADAGAVDRNNPFTTSFGRGPDESRLVSGLGTDLGLRVLASETGGVAVVNTNNFPEGVSKALQRGKGYYRLAYTPTEAFDGKFHKIQVKVKREDSNIHTASGYIAKEAPDEAPNRDKTIEILNAARSPLSSNQIGVSTHLLVKYLPDNRANLEIQSLVDAKTLNFQPGGDNKQSASIEIVGFISDQTGRVRGGYSETVNASLPPDSYQRALTAGIPHSSTTQLRPGLYQVTVVARETATGRIGSVSRFLEVPNLENKKLALSSLFFFGVNPADPKTAPLALNAANRLPRTQELRYAALIYNAKLKNNKPQITTQLIISQNGKALLREPEQPLDGTQNNPALLTKIGQLGLAKVQPGRYVLTLLVIDNLADKKAQRVARSAEFIVE
jgi:VWFA-related protein